MSDEGPVDDRLEDRLDALYEHLAATAERPVARPASAYLGEAEAVVRDLVERPAAAETVRARAEHVVDLLGEVGDTEDDVTDEHVAAALSLAEELVEVPADED